MLEERLTGLALASIHRDISASITPNEIIDILARKNRKLLFV